MKKQEYSRAFFPKEVLFSLTTACNLHCAHCGIEQSSARLNKKAALKFLADCADIDIKRVGFTGGEPFLALGLMCDISKEASRLGMLFGRVMTNGSWFGTGKELVSALDRLCSSGYDGDLCLSVDAFHRQDLTECAAFVRSAIKTWRRPDIVSIAAVRGAKEAQTLKKLSKFARLLNARLVMAKGRPAAIKSNELFIKIFYIDLSTIGKAAKLKDGWDGNWFKDDMCKGPGNVFFVMPDGTVKPCCGYGSDADILTLGSIKRDLPKQLINNARKNRFIASVFGSGLHSIRRRFESGGFRFPGKTTNHCLLCNHLTRHLPRAFLESYL